MSLICLRLIARYRTERVVVNVATVAEAWRHIDSCHYGHELKG